MVHGPGTLTLSGSSLKMQNLRLDLLNHRLCGLTRSLVISVGLRVGGALLCRSKAGVEEDEVIQQVVAAAQVRGAGALPLAAVGMCEEPPAAWKATERQIRVHWPGDGGSAREASIWADA